MHQLRGPGPEGNRHELLALHLLPHCQVCLATFMTQCPEPKYGVFLSLQSGLDLIHPGLALFVTCLLALLCASLLPRCKHVNQEVLPGLSEQSLMKSLKEQLFTDCSLRCLLIRCSTGRRHVLPMPARQLLQHVRRPMRRTPLSGLFPRRSWPIEPTQERRTLGFTSFRDPRRRLVRPRRCICLDSIQGLEDLVPVCQDFGDARREA
mmetsp:Transcript_61684/g.144690  ORF Transcript_61684/g.144690 Transcript_61684/m.144690 type:complete len:207 (-) Transcript_61684:64-684(-)